MGAAEVFYKGRRGAAIQKRLRNWLRPRSQTRGPRALSGPPDATVRPASIKQHKIGNGNGGIVNYYHLLSWPQL